MSYLSEWAQSINNAKQTKTNRISGYVEESLSPKAVDSINTQYESAYGYKKPALAFGIHKNGINSLEGKAGRTSREYSTLTSEYNNFLKKLDLEEGSIKAEQRLPDLYETKHKGQTTRTGTRLGVIQRRRQAAYIFKKTHNKNFRIYHQSAQWEDDDIQLYKKAFSGEGTSFEEAGNVLHTSQRATSDNLLKSVVTKKRNQKVANILKCSGGQGHLQEIVYSVKYSIMQCTFANECRGTNVCVLFDVPIDVAFSIGKAIESNEIYYNERVGKKLVPRHLAGVLFWEYCRVRFMGVGGRYAFQYLPMEVMENPDGYSIKESQSPDNHGVIRDTLAINGNTLGGIDIWSRIYYVNMNTEEIPRDGVDLEDDLDDMISKVKAAGCTQCSELLQELRVDISGKDINDKKFANGGDLMAIQQAVSSLNDYFNDVEENVSSSNAREKALAKSIIYPYFYRNRYYIFYATNSAEDINTNYDREVESQRRMQEREAAIRKRKEEDYKAFTETQRETYERRAAQGIRGRTEAERKEVGLLLAKGLYTGDKPIVYDEEVIKEKLEDRRAIVQAKIMNMLQGKNINDILSNKD